jgi:GMP synthase PP-ATPase subunit
MELVITFKQSESTESNFTYTKSECRLKLCKKHSNPINTELVNFCETIMNYLTNIQYPYSLRSIVQEVNSKFYVKLCKSSNHKDEVKFLIAGTANNLCIEDVDNAKKSEIHTC